MPASHLLPLLLLASSSAAAPPELPRYRFEAGQHLLYEGSESAQTSSGEVGLHQRAQLWVIGDAGDGSWPVIIEHRSQRYFDEPGGERRTLPERTDLMLIDLAPDGRVPQRDRDTGGAISRLLPRLPADATEMIGAWSYRGGDVVYRCRIVAGDAADRERICSFTVEPASDQNAIHGFSALYTCRLDTSRGMITEIAAEHRHEGKVTRTGAERLTSQRTMDAVELAALAHDAPLYFEAERRYRDRVAGLINGGGAGAGDDPFARAIDPLEALRPSLRSDLLGGAMDVLLAQARASVIPLAAQMQRNAGMIGGPAPAWALTDLDGKQHALADYHGRVVVLDFWYRACSWCIRAMPQLMALEKRFDDQPVAVLGINTDRDPEDARAVAERVKLTYPTLLATRELAQAYGVQAYPTLIVLDQAGAVRWIHRGYSPALEEELARVVEGLLRADVEEGRPGAAADSLRRGAHESEEPAGRPVRALKTVTGAGTGAGAGTDTVADPVPVPVPDEG